MGNNLIDEETICPKTMDTVYECCCKYLESSKILWLRIPN